MRLLRDTSISRKLKVVILATTSVALLIASAAFVTYDLVAFRQSMASDLSTLAKVIGTNSTASLSFNHRKSAKDVLSALGAKQEVVRARIYTSDSDLFAEYVRAGESGDIPLTLQPQSQVAFTNGYLVASETINLDGETIGTVYLISNLDAFRSRLKRFAGVAAAVLVGSLLIAFLLSSRLQGLISDPISHLATTARAVSINKDYTIRAVKTGRDEMGMLIDVFNEMLSQIEDRDVELQEARDKLERRVEERTTELRIEIIEREQAQAALRRSEEHFRSLIEDASDIITIADLDGTIRYASPSVERLLGYTTEEIVGRNAVTFIHPEDASAAADLLRAVAGKVRLASRSTEFRIKNRSGAWRTLEAVARSYSGDSGAAQVVINSRDVTERKTQERDLVFANTILQTQRETSLDGILVVDDQHRMVSFSSRFVEMWGLAASIIESRSDELALRSILNALESPDAFVESVGHLYSHPDEKLQDELKLKDGRTFDRYSAPMFGADGKYYGRVFYFRDVTDRKQAEQALYESGERYRALFDSNPQPLWVYDLETLSFLAVNEAAIHHYGYTREEFLAMTIRDIRPPEDVPALLTTIPMLNGDNDLKTTSWRHTKKGGTNIDVDITAHKLDFAGRRAELVLATDVTQRKQALKELQDSEFKYRTLFNQIADPIVIFDKATKRFVDCNDAVQRNYGYSLEELQAMTVFDLHPPEDLPNVERHIDARNADLANTYTHITKDGRHIDVEILTDEIEYQGQECWISIVRDVTQRKRTEERLLRLVTAVDQTDDSILITDTKGIIEYVNPSFERQTGYSSNEVIGQTPRILKSGQSSPTFYKNMWDTITQGLRWAGEFTNKKKDGSLFEEEATISPVRDAAGVIVNYVAVKRDVTARRKMEREVAMLASAIRSIHESVSITDTDDKILFVNDAFLHTYGYERDELIGRNVRALMRPDSKPIQNVMPSPGAVAARIWEGELINRRKDGTEFPIQLSASPILDEDGRTIALIGVAQDITTRKLAEEALLRSEERYRAVSETATDGIITIDHEGTITYINGAAEKMFGYSSVEIVGQQVTKVMPDILRDSHNSVFHRYAETGLGRLPTAEPIVVPIRHISGTEIQVELSVGESIHAGKRIFTCILRDITERKKMEAEVTMLAQAVRSIQEAVVVTDPVGNIIFVNDAAVGMFGYEFEEAVGQHVTLLHAARDSRFVDEVVRGAKEDRWEGEALSRRKNGAVFPAYLSASEVRDASGRSIAIIGVCQDITERKRSFEELQSAKEAAEAASRAKSEFLANMSHEIRTPMNGIIGMTELALDTELSFEQREYLNLVKLSSDSLLRVINDILDFSKIEAGKLELDLAEFSLQDSIDDVMKAMAVRADQKGLELAYMLRPGVPEYVVGDAGRLRQILVNLVGNAIKFTAGGEIIVRVDVDSLSDDQAILHFCVRDTGIGVPIEKQALIFESFTQADGSTTRKYGGTGLGLAISSRLVHAMNGKIWVDSPAHCATPNGQCDVEQCRSYRGIPDPECPQCGVGSIFHFTAAFAVPKSPVRRIESVDLSALQGLSVLVVDDNATNRRILEVQLTGWGVKPVMAENGAAALEEIKRASAAGYPFKMVISDLHMPGIDGAQLTKMIRQTSKGDDPKIIILSSARREDAKQSAGADAYLMKPVKASQLLETVRSVLGKNGMAPDEPARQRALRSPNPGRVLVAEDSAVNQELMKRLLIKWGHSVVIADDGQKALSLLETGSFDVVLMDVQMPELNGFEATATIRNKERGTDAHIPIIALTAHALKGDREKCIAAGMDDYISKPIEADKLFTAIEAAISGAEKPQERPHNNGHSPDRVFDAAALMLNLDGDLELLCALAEIFADTAPTQLSVIETAIANQNAEALMRGAHTLKGSIATFQARAAVDSAATLEKIGGSGDLSSAATEFNRLRTEIARLTVALNEMLTGAAK